MKCSICRHACVEEMHKVSHKYYIYKIHVWSTPLQFHTRFQVFLTLYSSCGPLGSDMSSWRIPECHMNVLPPPSRSEQCEWVCANRQGGRKSASVASSQQPAMQSQSAKELIFLNRSLHSQHTIQYL
jgi:hypothetical protein